MIILQSTDKLQILLGGTPTVEATWYAAYADHTATTFTPNLSSGVTTGATAVDVVGSPAASTQRQVKYVSIYNGDAATITVTARVSHNGTFRTLAVITLPAGSRIEYTDGLGWGLDDRTNKQPLDATLSAIAALATGADQLPYFTGTDTAAQTSLTSFTRSLLGLTTGAAWVSGIGAASASHSHDASNITTGTLVASRGGTGIGSYTAGNYVNALNATTLQQRTPAQVLSDIGAADSAHNHDTNYLKLDASNGPVTGDVTISKSSPAMTLVSSGGAARIELGTTSDTQLNFYHGAIATANKRWEIKKTGDAASDLYFNAFNDSGVYTSTPFRIARSTGIVNFSQTPTVVGVSLLTTTAGDAAYVNVTGDTMSGDLTVNKNDAAIVINSSANNATLQLKAINTAGSRVNFYTGNSSRWVLGKDPTNESGSNSGSDFTLIRYNDAGSSIDTPITITRSTGYLRTPGVYTQTTASAANVFVDSSGNLMRSTSTMQYKTDVEPVIPEYADKILELTPIWYRSLCDGDNKNWSYYGLSAEQVAEIIPQLAQYETTKPAKYADIDEDGNETNVRFENEPLEIPKPNGVMYERFTPLLISVIKRQKEQIDAILARLGKLEAM